MIAVRVLHLVPARSADPETLAAGLLARWLHASGHPQAIAAAEPGLPVVGEGIESFSWAKSRLAWWLGGRTRFLARIGTWVPDLIHAHGLAQVPLALGLARRLRLPALASIHRLVDPHAQRVVRDPLLKWLLVPTEFHRSHWVAEVGIDRDRVGVLPCGVDLAAAATRRPADGRLVVGVEAVPGQDSGLPALFEAVEQIRREGVQARIVAAVADESAARRVQQLATGLGVGGQVVLAVGNGAIDLVGRCDVLVRPDACEQPLLAAVQAMAEARPIIAVGVGGLSELVRDGESALIVPAGDAAAFAAALRQLADEVNRRTIGAAARASAEARFGLTEVGTAALEFYHAAIGPAPEAGSLTETASSWRRATEMRARRLESDANTAAREPQP